MKKEVTVCDVKEFGDSTCPTLARHVCPLCQRDVCPAHRATQIEVRISVVWPRRATNNGSPPTDQVVGAVADRAGICIQCFERLSRTPLPSTNTLVSKVVAGAIETYGADLAAAKLQEQDD